MDPRLALLEDPECPFFLPLRDFSLLPPLIDEVALGFELVETTDSAGELAPDS